ncbi:MAG: hypothetical protein J5J06_04980 [Phycisphaerae bacterium]|nr:hypothetical protein [Phycisphaerae bacterium]
MSKGEGRFLCIVTAAALLAAAAAAGGEPYFYLGGEDWADAMSSGQVVPMDSVSWDDYMAQWQAFGQGDPYPDNVFYPPLLYVWPGGTNPDYPPYPGLVMMWSSPGLNCCHCWNDNPPDSTCDQGDFGLAECMMMGVGWDHCEWHPNAYCNGITCIDGAPIDSLSSAWRYDYGTGPLAQGPVDLSNAIVTVSVTAPQFDMMGNQINAVSFGVQDVNGLIRSWQWSVGAAPAPIQWWVPTTITIDLTQVGVTAATPTASGYASAAGFNIQQSQFFVVDENAAWVGGPTPIPPPGGPPGAAWNYWHNLSVAPKPSSGTSGQHGPVSFSVNGMNTGVPAFDGPPVPGTPYFNPPWGPAPPPGTGPYGTVRLPPTPQPPGIATVRIGDVNDYFLAPQSPEAEIFQSEPDRIPAAGPSGTNNQILRADAMGLVHGLSNINAYSFGEDWFNGDEQPIPGGFSEVYAELWEGRSGAPGFLEPVVASGGLPITFYFSVDPFAVGLQATALRNEATLAGFLTLPAGPAGSADPTIGPQAWSSDGEAAGDVFFASPFTAPAVNFLDHDDALMALLAPRPLPPPPEFEDDLDAMEHVGTNTLIGGIPAQSGNTHDRVRELLPPDLADPNTTNHEPINGNPIIFSVDRGTTGALGSAVAAQVNSPVEGASGDLFVAVTMPPGTPFAGMKTNMLLIDEGLLGLMPHDDLDAVIVRLLIPVEDLEFRITDAAINFDPESPTGSSMGYGFTLPLLGPGDAIVGFSVDAGSIGLLFTAVDFECRVDGLGLAGAGFQGSGVMEQAGDIFYTDMFPPPGQMQVDQGTGLLLGQNYLWFEERMLGLDRGNWSFIPPGPSGNLADVPDELNALDSEAEEEPVCEPDPTGQACMPVPCPNPQDVCVPVLMNETAPGVFVVIQCECRDPNLCHIEPDPTGGPPACVGSCPLPEICTQVVNGTQLSCQCVGATGACCLPDGTCIDTTSVDCANQNGTYMGDGTTCGPQGSCCYDSDGDGVAETCTTTYLICCEQMLGGTFTTGGDCAPDGACCYVDPTGLPGLDCALMAEDCCLAMTGASFHVGETCDPIGACCWDSNGDSLPEVCDALPESCCSDLGGVFHAADTCTAPQACCLSGGACVMLDPVCCAEIGGTPQGLGSTCANAVCQACCLPDARCVETGHNDCVARGGDPQGPGTPNCQGVICSAIKWSQPPTFNPTSPTPECFWGWDEVSLFGFGPVVADDWLCLDGRPVTDIHWWGSYSGWSDIMPPPQAPMMFHIAIWTDVSVHDPGNQFPYSHPGMVIQEWYVDRQLLNEQPVACDFHPDFMQGPDGCYRYDFEIPEADWFVQENACTVYWLSIAAMYDTPPMDFPWGWKTRQPRWNDDAVRIFDPTVPGPGATFVFGEPITDLQGRSWDTSFVLTSNRSSGNKWEQPPNPAWPGYHAHEAPPAPPNTLADDWRCEGGVVTDLHWWGNYELNALGQELRGGGIRAFALTIFSDIPAHLNPPFNFSMPGIPLWTAEVQVAEVPTCLINPEGAPIYLYEYDLPAAEPFLQEQGSVYWLSVIALANDPADPAIWRWQEAARGLPYRYDSAVSMTTVAPGWSPLNGDLALRVTSTAGGPLLPPLPATGYPHATLKNRYISFRPDPGNTGTMHGYRVTHVPTGTAWFITPPATSPPSVVGKGLTRLCSNGTPPLYDFGIEPVIHVTGCLIAPAESYEVRATTDGVNFTSAITVSTVPIPLNGRWWCDAVGSYSAAGDGTTTPPTPPMSWTPPNTVMNGFDISAAFQAASSNPAAPHASWVDVNPEVCDFVVIGPDVLRFVNAFSTGSGKEFYPYNVPNPPGPQGQGACPVPTPWP